MRRRRLQRPSTVSTRWPPNVTTGTSGDPVATAIAAAPDASGLTCQDREIVDSG